MADRCMNYPKQYFKCGACHIVKAQDNWEFYGCRLLHNKACCNVTNDECPRYNDDEYWNKLNYKAKENNNFLI